MVFYYCRSVRGWKCSYWWSPFHAAACLAPFFLIAITIPFWYFRILAIARGSCHDVHMLEWFNLKSIGRARVNLTSNLMPLCACIHVAGLQDHELIWCHARDSTTPTYTTTFAMWSIGLGRAWHVRIFLASGSFLRFAYPLLVRQTRRCALAWTRFWNKRPGGFVSPGTAYYLSTPQGFLSQI